MKKFTLSSALNIIGMHFIISLIIFAIVFWTLPSLNLIDEKHKIQKIISLGEFPKGHSTRFLDFSAIDELLESSYMTIFLAEKLGDNNLAKFTLEQSLIGNIFLTFEGRRNTLIPTANTLMEKLQEYDKKEIEKKLEKIDRQLKIELEELEIFKNSMNNYSLTLEEIATYAKLQKIYDLEYDGSSRGRDYSSNAIGTFISLKNEDVNRRVNLKGAILTKENLINETQLIKSEGFKTVKYLFPVDDKEISKYYPSSILFFGISLIFVFLYNLILLNYHFQKSVK